MPIGKTVFPIRSAGPGQSLVAGSFTGNGTSSPADTAGKQKSRGWKVVRTNTGIYTVTISGGWAALIEYGADMHPNSAALWTVVTRAASDSAGTFLIYLYDSTGTLADAGTSDIVTFHAVCQDQGDLTHQV